jgi:biotin carboxyl carrier protein
MPKRLRLSADGTEWIAELEGSRISLSGVEGPLEVHDAGDGRFGVTGAGAAESGVAAMNGDVVWVSVGQDIFEFTVGSATAKSAGRSQDALTPPMPATVVRIAVKAGDAVKKGDVLVVLEAMKMELPLRAPHDGIVTSVTCREGELVQPGTILVALGS